MWKLFYCRVSEVPSSFFLQLDDLIWGWWETQAPKVHWLCPVSFFLLSLQKNLLYKDRMLETEADFHSFWGNFRVFFLDFNPEHMKIWSCLTHAFRVTFICDLCWSSPNMYKANSPAYFPMGHKSITFPSGGVQWLGSMCKLFWKLRQSMRSFIS